MKKFLVIFLFVVGCGKAPDPEKVVPTFSDNQSKLTKSLTLELVEIFDDIETAKTNKKSENFEDCSISYDKRDSSNKLEVLDIGGTNCPLVLHREVGHYSESDRNFNGNVELKESFQASTKKYEAAHTIFKYKMTGSQVVMNKNGIELRSGQIIGHFQSKHLGKILIKINNQYRKMADRLSERVNIRIQFPKNNINAVMEFDGISRIYTINNKNISEKEFGSTVGNIHSVVYGKILGL